MGLLVDLVVATSVSAKMLHYMELNCMLWKIKVDKKDYQVCCVKCHNAQEMGLSLRKIDGKNYVVCCGVGSICLKVTSVVNY